MDYDSDFTDSKAGVLQRLATLQRLREHATAGNRAAVLRSIESLIEQERKALERDMDDESV
jgi:hypothetical protein